MLVNSRLVYIYIYTLVMISQSKLSLSTYPLDRSPGYGAKPVSSGVDPDLEIWLVCSSYFIAITLRSTLSWNGRNFEGSINGSNIFVRKWFVSNFPIKSIIKSLAFGNCSWAHQLQEILPSPSRSTVLFV